ncbi:pyridoxine 5'-phosphate synthase [bacterium]|nr:pyridoxine 5'-phosphate synthase [bacterium]
MERLKLGVNVDHVATLREARGGSFPDPVDAAIICELAGCDSIVCHLREDRRHIQNRDLYLLKDIIKTKLNLELALSEEVVNIALDVKPDQVTLVPEKKEELTTEGGLDVIKNFTKVEEHIKKFKEAGIQVSLFIEPEEKQIDATKKAGAEFIEIHTGTYSESKTEADIYRELDKIIKATKYATSVGVRVNAGHGLNIKNSPAICKIAGIEELNIGQSIIARAVFIGLDNAVKEILKIMRMYEKKDN